MYAIAKVEGEKGLRILCKKDFLQWSGVLYCTHIVDSPMLFRFKLSAYLHKLGLGSSCVIKVGVKDCGKDSVRFRKGRDYEWLRHKGTDRIIKVWDKDSQDKPRHSDVHDYETGVTLMYSVKPLPWSEFERIDWQEAV